MPLILAIAYHSLVGSSAPMSSASWLLGELGVSAAASQKEQAPLAAALGHFNHVGLDLEVIEQEISRVAVVGLDAAHLRRR